MLTEPRIVERPETHYAAVAAEVRIPFGEQIGPLMDEAASYLASSGAGDFGPALFRYRVIDMPRLEVDFGFVTGSPVAGNERVRPGVLPAGRYVTVTYVGPYHDLERVTGTVIDWARQNEVEWDSIAGPDGDHFASRFEIYNNGPDDEPDPQKWETEIWIKARG
jgi:effector-binding domain-containing protein